MSDSGPSHPVAGDQPQNGARNRDVAERLDAIEARIARVEETVLGVDRNVAVLLQHFTNYMLAMEEVLERQFGPNAVGRFSPQPAAPSPSGPPPGKPDGGGAVIALFPLQPTPR